MTVSAGSQALTIGQLAAQSGVSARTIRYYERIGLLNVPERSPGGYRLYRQEAADLLQFIRQAKAVGLTLEEIAQVLGIRRGGQPPCQHVLALIDQKLEELARQQARLTALQHEWETLRRSTEAQIPADAHVCALIEHRS